jgi:LuxR family transcriptional regulator, maltose regulon positive regulatory protein
MTAELADERFMVPFLPPRHLPRPRLLDRLERAAPLPLTVLSAGAGAGKTVLLSEWAQQQDTPIGWLALTPSDDDPGRFWRLFLEAARAAGYPCPPSAWTRGGTVELLDSVFGRAAEPAGRPVIVLDDAHLLRNPEISAGLDRIVWRWPHRVRLLLAARSDPLLPLHRYRLGGHMAELRAADLAMTPVEARELLDGHGVRLPDEELRILTARTEGWAAGLRLAALRMEGSDRPADFVAQLAMDEGSIGEYLIEEVLAVLPEDVQRLLIRTSFLEDVTGSLAEAVTGTVGCEAVLTTLARTNSFVIPVDPARTVFRYHRLFRETLRLLARRESTDAERSRFARAADWYRGRRDLPNALKWSVRAGDAALARSVLTHGGLAEAFVGHHDLRTAGLLELARAPRPESASAAGLLEFDVSQRAIIAVAAEQPAAGELAATLVPSLDQAAGDPELRVTGLLADVMLGQRSGQFVAVDEAAERLLSDGTLRTAVEAVAGLRASVLLVQARARFSAGRLADVEPLLRRALEAVQPDEVPAVAVDVLSMLAFVGISAGRPRHADDAAELAGALLSRHPGIPRPVVLDLAIARRAYAEADLAAMAAAMRRVHAAGPVYADVGQAATVAYVQALVLAALGEFAEARTVLQDNSAVNRAAVGLFGVLRDRELASIEVALGRPRAALQLLARHRGSQEALVAEVVVARAYLALGDLGRALLVEAALCDAEIAHRRGDDGRALDVVDRALHLAAGEIVLPFVQATESLGPILARHGTLAARWPAPVPAVGRPDLPPPGHRDALPDPLTSREQAVLRLMATSMSAADIAAELFLSVSTVKTHMAAIYRKLSVGRRRHAVLRARELELL